MPTLAEPGPFNLIVCWRRGLVKFYFVSAKTSIILFSITLLIFLRVLADAAKSLSLLKSFTYICNHPTIKAESFLGFSHRHYPLLPFSSTRRLFAPVLIVP